jgi:hypothetical protein
MRPISARQLLGRVRFALARPRPSSGSSTAISAGASARVTKPARPRSSRGVCSELGNAFPCLSAMTCIHWNRMLFKVDTWTAAEWAAWVGVLAQSAVVFVVALTNRQLRLASDQLRADHERSRRERTLDLLQFWTEAIVPHAQRVYATRDLVSQLELKQCEALWRAEEMKLDVKHKVHFLLALSVKEEDLKLTTDGEFMVIPRHQVLRLRETMAFYLNCLEVVFCAWRKKIADSDAIEEEFGPLLAPAEGGYPVDQIREASRKYPSIKSFINHKKLLASNPPISKPVA